MTTLVKLCFLCTLLPLSAIASSPATLLSFDQVEEKLSQSESKIRILDTRTKAEFEKSHLSQARWVDIKAATALAAKPNGLADVAAWQAWIAPLGLSADTEVIIYGSGQQLEPARAWWLLRYLGVQNVALVDGNFTLWETEKRPLTNLTTLVRPGTFTIKIHRDRLANREDVLAVLENKSARIIDARSLAEFTGADAKSKRAGHIPEACHLEWTQLVSQDGKFLKLSELSARLAKAGVKPGEAVITHCQGGGRASVDAFVFEHLGHSTRNYYLGWSDWGNIADTPVATESKTNPKR